MIGHAIQHGRQDVNDSLALSYPDPAERRKAKRLARTVAVEFAEKQADGPPETHTVMVPIPHRLFVSLQALGKEHPERLGVSRYVARLLETHARSRGHDVTEVKRRPKTVSTVDPNPMSEQTF